jgi:flagellar hook-length control protein FliK
MGLVVQTPVNALLAFADVQEPGTPVAGGPAAGADAFANLLASLQEATAVGSTDLALSVDVLPGEACKPNKDGNPASDAIAALLNLSIPLPAQVTPDVQPDAATASGSGDGLALQSVVAAAGQAQPDVPAPADEADAAAPGSAETQNSAETAPAPAQQPDAATANAAPPEAAVQPEVVSEIPALTISAAPKKPDRDESPRASGLDAPPDESAQAVTATTNDTSVVRSVGNAHTESDASGHGDEHKSAAADGPRPRASVQGIAHAAANSAAGELRTATTEAMDAASQVADVPAPAPQTPPQVEHVARTVIEKVEAGGGEAKIHLDPAGLGEVTIHVHASHETVKLDIHAERPEAAQLLRDHTQDLSNLLGSRGLNLSDVNVGLGRGNGQPYYERDQAQARPASGEFASILGAGEMASIETHLRLRAAYNPDGAHIYRV